MATFRDDLWEEQYHDVVPSMADLLHGLCGVVCVQWRGYMGGIPLCLSEAMTDDKVV